MTSAQEMIAQSERAVARPLRVLVPLIKDDLKQGDEAAERAGLPFYEAAGDKILEAREGSFHDTSATAFWDWVKRSFNLSRTQAQRYLDLAEHNASARPRAIKTSVSNGLHKSFSDAIRDSGGSPRGASYGGVGWKEPVRQAISTFNPEAYAKDLKNKQQERDIERKLALKLIDIGFKVLAAQLHPDKRGGSAEAMTRLNNVRNRLKLHA